MSAASEEATAVAPGPAPGSDPKPPSRLRYHSGQIASRYAIVALWVVLGLVYALTEKEFFQPGTFTTIFSSQQPLVFMAAALLCTIIVGEFVDLSVPSVFGISATLVPVLVVNDHWGIWPAAIAGILVAFVVGVVQGYLVVVVGVNTIVVTLGMSTLLDGLALWVSDMNTISGLPSGFSKIALTQIGGLPISFYYGVLLVLIFSYVLWFTPLGKHMRFVGASREVSRLSGVRVNRIRFGSFVFAGLLSGIGAVIAVAGLGSYNATTSDTYLLPVFASVFLGTAIVETGRFNTIGTFIGIYFLETGIVGLQLLGLGAWVTDVFYGGVLVIAVTLSTLLRRRTS